MVNEDIETWKFSIDHRYNVVPTLIIQPTLLNNNQAVVRYFLTRNMLNEPIKNYPKNVQLERIFLPKFQKTK